jgi:hypothetical protein
MKRPKNLVSVLELKRLLIDIKEKRPDICFRYRLIGELWIQHFRQIVNVTDKGILLNDEVLNKLIALSDISSIMQFELDNRFQNYEPNFHYDVTPYVEFLNY